MQGRPTDNRRRTGRHVEILKGHSRRFHQTLPNLGLILGLGLKMGSVPYQNTLYVGT